MNKTIPFLLILVLLNGPFMIAFNSVSALEFMEDSWKTKTPMSKDRRGVGIVTVGDKIYVIGGDNESWLPVTTNECYDSKTDKWITLKSMPTPRFNLAVAEYQGKIYCIGGEAPDYSSMWYGGLDVNEVYDIATDSWSTKTAMPDKAACVQAHVVDGKIFVVTRSVLYMYDPNTDIWTSVTDIPSMDIAFSVMVDNKIIIGIPIAFMQQSPARKMQILIYDPRADRWSEGKTGQELRYRYPIAAAVTTGQYAPVRVYVSACIETYDENSALCLDMINQVYDPINDTWTTSKAMPMHRGHLSIAVVKDILYAFADGPTNEQYIPIGYRSIAYTTPTATISVVSSEEPFLDAHIIAAILALSIGVAVTGLLIYGRKRKGIRDSSNVNYSLKGSKSFLKP